MRWAYAKLVELIYRFESLRGGPAPSTALVHVASDRHQILYRRDFGISKIIWEHSLADDQDREAFLTSATDRLLQNLDKWVRPPNN